MELGRRRDRPRPLPNSSDGLKRQDGRIDQPGDRREFGRRANDTGDDRFHLRDMERRVNLHFSKQSKAWFLFLRCSDGMAKVPQGGNVLLCNYGCVFILFQGVSC